MQLKIQKIKSIFETISNWEDRYKKIIEIGKKASSLPDHDKKEELKVKGCQSQVWLKAEMKPNGEIHFEGDSDALIVKGLVSILIQVYSESRPEEILTTPPDFLNELGFSQNLSPSRANGLNAMIKQMMYYAKAFQILSQGRKFE